MREYKYKFVPGPTSIPKKLFEQAYCQDLASADLEDEFFQDYEDATLLLKKILHTDEDVIIMSGEGMVALWGGIKSCIKPGDTVISISNGLYGAGFGAMCKLSGANVTTLSTPTFRDPIDIKQCCERIKNEKPKVVTMVHCETPSGFLNPLQEIGECCRKAGSTFVVDFVSSAIGAELYVDKCCIDIGFLGSQKALSLKPDLSIVTVSKAGWKKIEEGSPYIGYDSLSPFKTAIADKYFPYTHNWHSILALKIQCQDILNEGLKSIWQRHLECRDVCIKRSKEIGLELYPRQEFSSPTVTALLVPEDLDWNILNAKLKDQGVGIAGSYDELKGKVMRIGHMGSQAIPTRVLELMNVIDTVICDIRKEKKNTP